MAPLLLILLVTTVITTVECINNRPIIGIFTQPSDSEVANYGKQYIAASYVKFIESAGARVVPIRYSISTTEAQSLFKSINGFLLPGGGTNFEKDQQYWLILNTFYNLAVQANQQGDYFPVWGTCQGFEELCVLQSQNQNLLASFNSENYTVPLNFTPLAKTSRLFGSAPSNIVDILGSQPVTMNNHQYGVAPADWNGNNHLTDFFNILSTNVDRAGKQFVSTIEGKTVPVYASQWHPEKVGFEWNINEVINHSTDSVLANQYVASFFVTESRRSNHSFATVALETAALIYNYQPVYTYPKVNDFEQCYFFN